METKKISVITYGLLIASVIGTLADRPSRPLETVINQTPNQPVPWQNNDDDDDEYSIIVTRFLFPEKPQKPASFH